MFPLNILPPTVGEFLSYTPFPYLLFFPVSIYLNQVTGPALYRGLLIQAFWIGVAFLLAKMVWHRGIKKYGAVGG